MEDLKKYILNSNLGGMDRNDCYSDDESSDRQDS